MILNITNEVCPMAFVKLKVALYELAEGDILEALVSGEDTVKNICASLREENVIPKVEPVDDGVYKITIAS